MKGKVIMKKVKILICIAIVLALLTSCVIFAVNAFAVPEEEALDFANAKTLQEMYGSVEFTHDDIMVVYNPNIDTYYTYINYKTEDAVNTAVFMQNTYIDTLQAMAELAQSDSSESFDFVEFEGMYMPYITYQLAVKNLGGLDITLVKAEKIAQKFK